MIKMPALLVLAAAIAAPASAQTDPMPAEAPGAERPLLQTNWSLKPAVKKRRPIAAAPAPAGVGPAVPPPMRIKVPRSRTAARQAAPPRSNRANGTRVIGALVQEERRKN